MDNRDNEERKKAEEQLYAYIERLKKRIDNNEDLIKEMALLFNKPIDDIKNNILSGDMSPDEALYYYYMQAKKKLDESEEAAAKFILARGNWHDGSNSAAILSRMYNDFTDKNLLYNLIRNVYYSDGNNFPLPVILKLKELVNFFQENNDWHYLNAYDTCYNMDYPDEFLSDQKEFTVYRATGRRKNIEKQYSWTLDLNTAIWFAHRFDDMDMRALSIYEAKISRNDVLAYIKDRGEDEIVQYDSVYDIQLLKLSKKQVHEALQRRSNK